MKSIFYGHPEKIKLQNSRWKQEKEETRLQETRLLANSILHAIFRTLLVEEDLATKMVCDFQFFRYFMAEIYSGGYTNDNRYIGK